MPVIANLGNVKDTTQIEKEFDDLVNELKTTLATKGTATKLIYIENGEFKVSEANIGNSRQLVYLENGEIKAGLPISDAFSATSENPMSGKAVNGAIVANNNSKIGVSKGSTTQPVFVDANGVVQPATGNVGNEYTPMYLKNGVMTQGSPAGTHYGDTTPPSTKMLWIKSNGTAWYYNGSAWVAQKAVWG